LVLLKQLDPLEKRALARGSERGKTIPTISEDFGVNIEYVHDNNKNLKIDGGQPGQAFVFEVEIEQSFYPYPKDNIASYYPLRKDKYFIQPI
jgi:hypothetical protein